MAEIEAAKAARRKAYKGKFIGLGSDKPYVPTKYDLMVLGGMAAGLSPEETAKMVLEEDDE